MPALGAPKTRVNRLMSAGTNESVMRALGAGIHVLLPCTTKKDVDGRVTPGHDELCYVSSTAKPEHDESYARLQRNTLELPSIRQRENRLAGGILDLG